MWVSPIACLTIFSTGTAFVYGKTFTDSTQVTVWIAASTQASRGQTASCLSAQSHLLDPKKGWWVDREVTRALERERRSQESSGSPETVLIPIDIDGHLFSPSCSHFRRDDLRARVAAPFMGWKEREDKYADGMNRLLRALRTTRGPRPFL
jgi:hypothetical protein